MSPVPDVKFCGLCRPADAAAAAEAGAAFAGTILTPGHRRSRTWREAEAIYAAAPDLRRVGVFVDAALGEVLEAARDLGLDVVQLHGAEPPALVEAVAAAGPWEVWKALRPRTARELAAGIAAYGPVAGGLLVEGWHPTAAGGAGAAFPLEAVAAERRRFPSGRRFVAAGGLHPDNVAAVVAAVVPDVVDVSSGVERAPGEKDPERMRAFVARVRAAGTSLSDSEGRE